MPNNLKFHHHQCNALSLRGKKNAKITHQSNLKYQHIMQNAEGKLLIVIITKQAYEISKILSVSHS